MLEINLPDVVAEVRAAFDRYESGIQANDPEILSSSFWNDPLTLRYGIGENLHGWDEITAFRQASAGKPLARTLEKTVITSYGRDMATANTLFHRGGKLGRQSQTWMRTDDGWRVVSAHVSFLPQS
jgi:hypothetical protein